VLAFPADGTVSRTCMSGAVTDQQLMAVPIAITAFVPYVLVIIPMVITIIIAFGGFNDAAHG
jgi:hypothetical protein